LNCLKNKSSWQKTVGSWQWPAANCKLPTAN
jgi:hypothetical protein